MSIAFDDKLKKILGDTERVVKRTVEQMRRTMHRAMASETRMQLKFTNTDREVKAINMKILVVPGYPEKLVSLVEAKSDWRERLLLATKYRRALQKIDDNVPDLIDFREELMRFQEKGSLLGLSLFPREDLKSLQNWLKECLAELEVDDPISKILMINEDILGVYRYRKQDSQVEANWAQIEIYWAVIGMIALNKNWEIDALTTVVLAHELGHAYTQLGEDADGKRWDPTVFSDADTYVKEGLAQYYTQRVLDRVDEAQLKAKKVFNELTECQSPPYQIHRQWENASPEAVRRAMVEMRQESETTLEQFEMRLKEAKRSLSSRPKRR